MICNAPSCGGCYEVEPGVHIHPPKTDTMEWSPMWQEYWEKRREERERASAEEMEQEEPAQWTLW
jgi:hypothetical protein